MDFFTWGYMKERLYRGQAFPGLEVLVGRIGEETARISVEMCRRALGDFWERLLVCELRGGMNVEVTN
jgi:hypothetical protein